MGSRYIDKKINYTSCSIRIAFVDNKRHTTSIKKRFEKKTVYNKYKLLKCYLLLIIVYLYIFDFFFYNVYFIETFLWRIHLNYANNAININQYD